MTVSDVQDQSSSPDRFQAEDFVLFIDRRQREQLVRLTPGKKIKLRGEYLEAERFIGLEVGSSIVTPLGLAYLALRPTLAERIMNMPREAQIIYPKDLGPILFYADVHPGCRVIEIGVGHGAMTMSLVRAVGSTGRVVSYERRSDFARRTRANLKRYLGPTPWWEIKTADPAESGLAERDFDLAVVDVPAPWELVEALTPGLKPGGPAVFFLPTVPQVVRLVEGLKSSGKFAHFQTIELLQRPWNIDGPSVRPHMRISGHTGFITTCRRKLSQVVRLQGQLGQGALNGAEALIKSLPDSTDEG